LASGGKGGITTRQKLLLAIAGIIVFFCALLVAAPEPWSRLGLVLPASISGANSLFRWIVVQGAIIFGCILVFVGIFSDEGKN
jgi:hypothetical protein